MPEKTDKIGNVLTDYLRAKAAPKKGREDRNSQPLKDAINCSVSLDDIVNKPHASKDVQVANREVVDDKYMLMCQLIKEHYLDVMVAGSYKGMTFDATKAESWQSRGIMPGDRVNIYSFSLKNDIKKAESTLNTFTRFLEQNGEDVKGTKFRNYISYHFEVLLEDGLHMRPALNIVNAAAKYDKRVVLQMEGKPPVDAKSMMEVCMMAARKGTVINVFFEPSDRQKTLPIFYEMMKAVNIQY